MNRQKECESNGRIEVDEYPLAGTTGMGVRLRSTELGGEMLCTPGEWHAFLADIAAGKWAHIGAGQEVTS